MSNIKPRTFRGTLDYYGSTAVVRSWMISIISQTFESFGFERLETPIIETEETLSGKYGVEGDMKRFKLAMRASKAAGLRYDHTVPLARFMAMNWNRFPLPYRRYAIGSVFRNESPSAGRLRQFTQCDFDTVGSKSPIVDAEIVAMNYAVLERLGFGETYTVMINDRRLLNAMLSAMGVTETNEGLAILRAWDKLEKLDHRDVFEQLVDEIIRQQFDGAFPAPTEVEVEQARSSVRKRMLTVFMSPTEALLREKNSASDSVIRAIASQFPTEEVRNALRDVSWLLESISSMGVPNGRYRFNPLMARGLDYYTGPIFETYVTVAGIGSITGGGRFDNLIALMGGPNMAASGSSFGLERLYGVMEQIGILPEQVDHTDAMVTVFDPADADLMKKTFALAAKLRLTGMKVEVYTGDTLNLGKQFQVAGKKDITFVLVIGPDELRDDKVLVKNMNTGSQVSVDFDSIDAYLKDILQG